MSFSLLTDNFLSPPILFFFLGMMAVFVKSSLEIPQPLPKLFSLYLLFAIGFHGGTELARTGFHSMVLISLGLAMLMAVVVPIYTFFLLRARLDVYNAAAIAATYGSISAVTFITAGQFLNKLGVPYGGHMVAAMALMESPAIVIGVLMVRLFDPEKRRVRMKSSALLREAFFNGSVFLLVGSFLIGVLTGPAGAGALKPFAEDIFKGMLSLFLLDMGLIAARRIRDLKAAGWTLPVAAVLVPILNAALGILIAAVFHFSSGDALMFTILCASASYIAVPAALRMSIPESNPSLYVPMALAITFPFNILAGIPLYYAVIEALWS